MNKFKMSTALLLMGFMVAACGEGFKPLTAKSKSVTPQVVADQNVAEKAQQIADQQNAQLYPDSRALETYKATRQSFAASIKGLAVVLSPVNNTQAMINSPMRFAETYLATGCDTINKKTAGVKVESPMAVDFSYLGSNPTQLISLGQKATIGGSQYDIKMACHDKTCAYANLVIKGKVETATQASFTTTFLVLMKRVVNSNGTLTGTYTPIVAPALAGDRDPRFYEMGPYNNYVQGCTQQTTPVQNQLPESNPLPGLTFVEPPAGFDQGANNIQSPFESFLGSINLGNALGSIGNLFSGDNNSNTNEGNDFSQDNSMDVEGNDMDADNSEVNQNEGSEQQQENLFDPNDPAFQFNL